MPKKTNTKYSKVLSDRINELIRLSELETSGFAEYTGVSESHVYAILNGTRKLTRKTADKIAEGFNLKGLQLLNLDYKITSKNRNTQKLNKFYSEYKGVKDYFTNTKAERSAAYFFEHELLKTKLFTKAVSISEVRDVCKASGRNYESKKISQILKYLVKKNILKSKKKPIRLKSGKPGTRIVDVFYK